MPLTLPPVLPMNTLAAAAPACGSQRRTTSGPAPRKALFRAHWGEARDLAAPEAVADVAHGLGIARDDLLAAVADPRIKERLAQTRSAIERGVFGSPFIFVDGEPFWGADRLPQVERAASGRKRPVREHHAGGCFSRRAA